MVPPALSRFHSRRTVSGFRRRLVVRVTCTMVVLTGLVATSADATIPRSRETPSHVLSSKVPVRLPGRVPARICGARSLDGPSSPPAGAKVVRAQNLGSLALRSRKGRVFWLAPGIHTLGGGQYSQVIPKDRQVFIGAPGAVIDGQHKNLYAFTGKARGVRVKNLTITHFGKRGDNGGEGVVNHDSGHGWLIAHDTISHNAGAGVFLGTHTRVVSSCLSSNGEYGFQSYSPHGPHDVVLRHNEISYNNADDWESIQPGCGCSGGGKFWDTRSAVVLDNWVHHNHGPGLWADTNDRGFLFKGNYVSDNDDVGIFYEISYNARITHNTFVRNGIQQGPRNSGFPVGAIYISESGSDPRVHTRFRHTFRVARNRFVDNWAGVMAWENPDRFAGSPYNSSTGFTTLVSPGVATESHCSDPALIGTRPYFDDCRWKTQNMKVTHNRFVMHRSRIPHCTADLGCGWNGLVSNYGTVPAWSPYKRYVVPRNITFHQHNKWARNSYIGSWRWLAYTLGNRVTWRRWRGHFGQDAHSTRH
jgi:parallel beta-helix repeat protein